MWHQEAKDRTPQSHQLSWHTHTHTRTHRDTVQFQSQNLPATKGSANTAWEWGLKLEFFPERRADRGVEVEGPRSGRRGENREGRTVWMCGSCDLRRSAVWCAHTGPHRAVQLDFPRSPAWTNGLMLRARTRAPAHTHAHTRCKFHCNVIRALCCHAQDTRDTESLACHGKEARRKRRRRRRGAPTLLLQQTSVFAVGASLFVMTRTQWAHRRRVCVCVCVGLPRVRETDRCKNNKKKRRKKNITTAATAALQRQLINSGDRCYLQPLTSGVMRAVISSPHTHRLRRVLSTAQRRHQLWSVIPLNFPESSAAPLAYTQSRAAFICCEGPGARLRSWAPLNPPFIHPPQIYPAVRQVLRYRAEVKMPTQLWITSVKIY